ncbi:alpha--mannosyltransferase [Lasallia pustulata]|uniref:Alpha--mannosyltransferase n=1 Tax=Lasallia pustulata TaxID=136370 RepID=A0A1W5CTZ4_9LECA|nr:alpha--mannosyltransferase [Lasallia pustulata]
MPPGDPREAHRATQSPTLPLSRVHLRVDWQTLRRLPLSGAIVFNFKALFTPVTEFRDEAYIPALVAKILKEGKEGLMRYKGTWHVEHVVLPAMEEWKEEQVRRGVVVEGWEESTLEESPWFPGWEEKWHRQQGF